jgi:ADP-ribose pyrophosphatase YjhB (NUDIX family)
MKTVKKTVVLGIIEDSNGNILVCQRNDPKIKDAHLKWDVPGGTNEPGESFKETLIREVKEETGLNIEILELMPGSVSKEWKHEDYLQQTEIFCYHCRMISGEIQLGDPKIKDLKWIKPEEELDWISTTKRFIDFFNAK